MADSAAAIGDERLRPPRQGDSDEGRRSCSTSRATIDGDCAVDGRSLFGRQSLWPRPASMDLRTTVWTALAPSPRTPR